MGFGGSGFKSRLATRVLGLNASDDPAAFMIVV